MRIEFIGGPLDGEIREVYELTPEIKVVTASQVVQSNYLDLKITNHIYGRTGKDLMTQRVKYLYLGVKG